MRILYLVPDLFVRPGGIARYCALVCKALLSSSHVERLDIMALSDDPSTVVDASYLSGSNYTFRGFGGKRVRFALHALQAIARGHYDLLLSGHVNLTPILMMPTQGTRRITFIYGTDVWSRLPWHRRWPLAHTDMISISNWTARVATSANSLPAGRVRILHNCLDPSFNIGGRSNGVPTSNAATKIVLTVSRLTPPDVSKGHRAVIRALPDVITRFPDVEYRVVGDGELRGQLEALGASLGVRDHIRFLGWLPEDELRREYANATVFAMPSSEEGFGFVFLEAMAHAKPVIAGIADAGPEVVGENEAGLLVDPHQPAQVSEALINLLGDASLRDRLGDAGRGRVQRLFQFEQFRTHLLRYVAPGN